MPRTVLTAWDKDDSPLLQRNSRFAVGDSWGTGSFRPDSTGTEVCIGAIRGLGRELGPGAGASGEIFGRE